MKNVSLLPDCAVHTHTHTHTHPHTQACYSYQISLSRFTALSLVLSSSLIHTAALQVFRGYKQRDETYRETDGHKNWRLLTESEHFHRPWVTWSVIESVLTRHYLTICYLVCLCSQVNPFHCVLDSSSPDKAWNFLMQIFKKKTRIKKQRLSTHFLDSTFTLIDLVLIFFSVLLFLLLSLLRRPGQSSFPSHKCPRLRGERHLRGAELGRARTQRQGAAHLLRGAGQSLLPHTCTHTPRRRTDVHITITPGTWLSTVIHLTLTET